MSTILLFLADIKNFKNFERIELRSEKNASKLPKSRDILYKDVYFLSKTNVFMAFG